ncbi:MAG: sigma 54-interacting transcriptional regulator [bacterium]
MKKPAEAAREEIEALKGRLSGLADGPERVGVLLELARLLRFREPRAALPRLEEAARLASAAGDQSRVALSSYRLAQLHSHLGSPEQAAESAQRALAAARASGEPSDEAMAYRAMATVAQAKGEYAKARESFEKAIAASEAAGDREGRYGALQGLANVSYAQGRHLEALGFERQCLELADRPEQAAAVQMNIGLTLHGLGRLEESAGHYYRAMAICEEHGFALLSVARHNLGILYLTRNRLDEAADIFSQVVAEERRNPTEPAFLGCALMNLGVTHERSGNHAAAERAYTESAAILERTGRKDMLANLYGNIASLAVAEGRLDRARDYVERSYRLADELDLRPEQGDAWAIRARVRSEEGDAAGAKAAFEQAIGLLADNPESDKLARTRLEYAKHLVATGEPGKAGPLLRQALEAFRNLTVVTGSEEANRLLYELERPDGGEAALAGAVRGLAATGLEPNDFFARVLGMLCEGLGFESGVVLAGDRPVVLRGRPRVDRAVELCRQGEPRCGESELVLPVRAEGRALGGVFLSRSKPGAAEQGRAVLADIADCLSGPLGRQAELFAAPAGAEAEIPGLQYRGFVGANPVVLEALKTVVRVAGASIPVLIRGESGTGKELAARALHESGARRDKPFVAVNCAAVPEGLLEAEFFGIEKGAATGVVARRGKFEQADGGTVFLDEIGDMSAGLQARLLRVVQDKKVEPVGGGREVAVDVRVVAATNQPLEELIEQGRFRQDLYYRLNGVEIGLPPLRERRGDIPGLVRHFIARSNQRFGRELVGASEEAVGRLMAHGWPGNVRQLRHVVERSVVLARGRVLEVGDLPPELRRLEPVEASGATGGLREARRRVRAKAAGDLERAMIIEYLGRAEWNVSKAAELAGYSRAQFYRLMRRHEVVRPDQ